MRLESPLHIAAACLLPLVASGCLRVPQQSASLAAMQASEVTAAELQLRVYEAGRRLSSIVEGTADTIAARSPDPALRRKALRWKIAAIPLIEEASLRPDPLVAVVDLWGFTMQLSDYLERGDGRDAFGDLQPLAVAAADTLERLAGEVATRVVGAQRSKSSGQALEVWAKQHPLRGADLTRESVLSSNWKALSITESSLTGTVASVQRNLVGVSNRLGYLNEGIFKRVQWQSELVASDLIPPLLESGREAILRDIAREERKLLAAMDAQRSAIFAAIAVERTAVFDSITGEREATLAALSDERVAVFDAVRAERSAAIASMDSVAQRSIDHAGAVASRLLLWSVVALAALATLVAVLVVWVVRLRREASTHGG